MVPRNAVPDGTRAATEQGARLAVTSLLFGVALGGLFTVSSLSSYSPVSIPILAFVPIVGCLLYFWLRSVEEILVGWFVVSLLGSVIGGLSYATHLFVVDDVGVIERRFVLMQSAGRAALLLLAAGVLVGMGLILASTIRNEVVPSVDDSVSHRKRRAIVVGATAVTTVGPVLFGREVVANYVSALAQRETAITVSSVDADGESVTVEVRVPNAMNGPLTVEWVLVRLRATGPEVTEPTYPDAVIPPGEVRRIPVEASIEPFDTGTEVMIDGYVRVSAFTDYEERIPIEPTRTTIGGDGS